MSGQMKFNIQKRILYKLKWQIYFPFTNERQRSTLYYKRTLIAQFYCHDLMGRQRQWNYVLLSTVKGPLTRPIKPDPFPHPPKKLLTLFLNQIYQALSSRLTFEKGYRRVKRFWTKMCSQTYSKRSVTAFRWINEDRFLGVFNMATSSLKKISLISNPLHYMIVILCKNNNNKFILSVSSSTTICIEPLVLCIK